MSCAGAVPALEKMWYSTMRSKRFFPKTLAGCLVFIVAFATCVPMLATGTTSIGEGEMLSFVPHSFFLLLSLILSFRHFV
jgi:hypothetical protein